MCVCVCVREGGGMMHDKIICVLNLSTVIVTSHRVATRKICHTQHSRLPQSDYLDVNPPVYISMWRVKRGTI